MSYQLPIPDDLNHLIEKRMREEDRRQDSPRRSPENRREVNVGPIGAIESAESIDDIPDEDQRNEPNRRPDETNERRKENRR